MNEQDRDLSLDNPPEILIEEQSSEEIPQIEEEPQIDDSQFIKLNRTQLAQEINRLLREDKDFAQVYTRDIGNKAKTRYQPQIDALTRQNEALVTAMRRAEFQQMTPEQINTRFQSDPEFAREYTEVLHSKPTPTSEVNPAESRRQMIMNILSAAERNGLPENQLNEIKQNISQGQYDNDVAGNPQSFEEGVASLQDDILNRLSVQRTPPKPVEKPHVDTASPSMQNGGGNTRPKVWTQEEIKNMSWEDYLKIFPNEGDYSKAVREGRVIIPGLNDQ